MKSTETEPPAATANGPRGFGGMHVPYSGNTYVPDPSDLMISSSRTDPSASGSNAMLTDTSVPSQLVHAGADTDVGAWKKLGLLFVTVYVVAAGA